MAWATAAAATAALLAAPVWAQSAAAPPAKQAALPEGFPSPWASGGAGWDFAYYQAKSFVGNLTLVEKVNLTTGTGWENERCIGNTGSVPRMGFQGFCLEDGPVGVRYSESSWALC